MTIPAEPLPPGVGIETVKKGVSFREMVEVVCKNLDDGSRILKELTADLTDESPITYELATTVANIMSQTSHVTATNAKMLLERIQREIGQAN